MARSNKSSFYLKTVVFASVLGILLTSSLKYFLPASGVEKSPEKPFHPQDSFKIGDLFVDVKKAEKPKPKPKKKEKIYDLKKWRLQLTYISGYTAYVIIQDVGKNEILQMNEVYKGYELVEVHETEAVFSRDGKLYSIKTDTIKSLEKAQKARDKSKNKKDADEVVDPADTILEAEKLSKDMNITAEIDPDSEEISSATVKRKDLQFFMKNPSQIWNNIKLRDYREDRQLKGFKVLYVKKGSPFEQLGLQKGDIIVAIDGDRITSYSQVQRYYKNIDRLRSMNLTISRNGEEKDIDYEVE
ncbi:type II secretory pathway, component PulC [Thiovulum sp. ES]|nr:type II secretory pathway, component PulC [Thiovulum sp. ES]